MSFLLALFLIGSDIPDTTKADRLAPLASFLLPGTGELIRGYKVKGEVFLWTDGLVMAGVAGFGWDAAGKRNAAIYDAEMNAGANPSNRTHKYLAAMESNLSSNDYNLNVTKEARNMYPDDLAKQQEYITANSFVGDDIWSWQTDSLRIAYLNERNNMRRAWQTSQALMGVMLLTRIVSLFDVSFFSPPQGSRFGLETGTDLPGIKLVYRFY